MGLGNIVRTRLFRNFMAKLYGWGAAVVILGALFKINHYPGADYMLIVGLGTESLIFFFSAFEPPYVEADWSLVYPELSGMYHGSGIEGEKPIVEELDDMLEEANIGPELIENLGKGLRNLSENTRKMSDVSDAVLATNEYTSRIQDASESANELTKSYKKTSEVLTRDAGASQEYANNIKSASVNAASLSNAYSQASDNIKTELSATEEFTENIKAASATVNQLTDNYSKSVNILSKSAEALDLTSLEGQSYNEELKKIATNLAALNSVYELQLQSSNQQVESYSKLHQTIDYYLENLNASAENTEKYKENMAALNAAFELQIKGSNKQVESVDQLQETLTNFLESLNASSEKTLLYKEELDILTERVAALNKVYGNMLTAMNVGSLS